MAKNSTPPAPAAPAAPVRLPCPDGLQNAHAELIVALAAVNACRRKAAATLDSLKKIMDHADGPAFLASREIHPAEALRQLRHAAAEPANPAAAEG